VRLQRWTGTFQGVERDWLQWADVDGNLILTDAEQAQAAEQRATSAEQRAEALAQRLRDLGVEP